VRVIVLRIREFGNWGLLAFLGRYSVWDVMLKYIVKNISICKVARLINRGLVILSGVSLAALVFGQVIDQMGA
jgi:hypothetical protein